MRIFRIEDPQTGDGPYNTDWWDGQYEMSDTHNGSSRHVHPIRDPQLGMVNYHERCGCDGPASLLGWFDGWLDQLDAAGFTVVELEAEEARVGQYGQVVYNTEFTEIIRTISIPEFIQEN